MQHTEIHNIKQLANFLRCDFEFLEAFLNGSIYVFDRQNHQKESFPVSATTNSISKSADIERFYIQKKNKRLGYRIVHKVVSDNLSNILKILCTELNKLYDPPSCVHGFVEDRNIKTNANLHLGKKYILSVDISLFFESITSNMVSASLCDLGFTRAISEYISQITTINGKLVQGYNTSPVIANIVAKKLDSELISYSHLSKIIYSRYADDLYFSSDETIPKSKEIGKIVENHNFILNPLKSKLMIRGRNQFVTGLSVFDRHYPRIPKRIKKNLRLEIYYIKKYGFISHSCKILNYSTLDYTSNFRIRTEVDKYIFTSHNRIMGWLYFINSIEPRVAKTLIVKYRDAQK